MTWHASGELSYQSGEYHVYWGIQRWTAYRWSGNGSKKLGEGASAKVVMAICEADQAKLTREAA